MGASQDPKAMQMAVSQLEAAKRSREQRAGANERREAKPAPGGPRGGSDDWLGDFYRDNNIGGRGGSLDREARDYWTQEAQTRGRDAVMDSIRGTAQDQGTWGGPRKPMPEKPPRDIGGRPVRPPRDTGGRPFPFPGDMVRPLPYPPRGEDQFGPGRPFPGFPGRPPGEGSLPGRPPSKPFPGRPIGDDQFPVGEDPIGLFPIPGRPPKKPPFFEGPLPRPDRPDRPIEGKPPEDDYFDKERFEKMFPGRPRPGRRPVEEHPWGREDDPNYGRKKSIWHQRKRAAERREHEFRRALRRRRGGIDFGPGRGSRIDRNVPRPEMETGVNTATGFNTGLPGGDFINPEQATRGREYLDFMKRLMLQKQGQFNR